MPDALLRLDEDVGQGPAYADQHVDVFQPVLPTFVNGIQAGECAHKAACERPDRIRRVACIDGREDCS